ncbi:MAG TPA: ASPIC/UnbV domain-containing protein [Candidatus Polarisedimenticolia bacterium]|nr:ASPIC/UnbV domain-containing protein [Candidatus Polarisedimenticolia bacterium]
MRTAWPRVLAEYPLSQSRWRKVRGRHFGLGSNGAVDRIEIRWPNGNSESFPGGSADRFLALIEGRGGTPHGS